MEKLYTSKTFLKRAGGRMHTPHPTFFESALVVSYRNHEKSLACFSRMALSVLFFFYQKAESERGGHGTMASF